MVSWIIAAFALVVAGCAEDELEPREAAYPESIGVTPPGERHSSANAAVRGGSAAANEPPVPPESEADTPARPVDVVVGDGPEEGEPAAPTTGTDAPVAEAPAVQPPGEPPPDSAPPDGYADADPSALTDFRPSLDPYGTWTEDPNYGTVWVPSPDVVGQDFAPYASAGHWAYDDDYVWVSDYDWGWVPFHYGRWAYGRGVGWEWIPGRRYAGAWVSWRYGEGGYGYVGWAPRAPTWGWRGGVALGLRGVPQASYTFVGTRDLFAHSVGPHVVAGPLVQEITAHTHPWVSSEVEGRRGIAEAPMAGPSPATLGIAASSIVRTTAGDRGVVQARAFARPNTALALGGRAPQGAGSRGWQYGGAWRPSTTLRGGPSHFGGRLGAGFVGSPNAAGPMRSPATLQGRPYYASPHGGSFSPYGGVSRGTATSLPTYRSPAGTPAGGSLSHPGFYSAGAYHSGYGSGGSRGSGGRTGGGGRGGGHR